MTLRHAVKNLLHSLRIVNRGKKIKLPLGYAAGNQNHIVLRDDVPKPMLDFVPHIAQVKPLHTRVTSGDQRRPNRVIVAAPDLMRRHARLHFRQLVAGRDDRNFGLG